MEGTLCGIAAMYVCQLAGPEVIESTDMSNNTRLTTSTVTNMSGLWGYLRLETAHISLLTHPEGLK